MYTHGRVAAAPDRVLVLQEILKEIEQARAEGDEHLVASLRAEYRLARGDL